MRGGAGNHTAPGSTQGNPPDITTDYVMWQVRLWSGEAPPGGGESPWQGKLIHPETAREIAAWWQGHDSDGRAFGRFASEGTITEGFASIIADHIAIFERDLARPRPVSSNVDETRESIRALKALAAYIGAATPTVYLYRVGTTDYTFYVTGADMGEATAKAADVTMADSGIGCEITQMCVAPWTVAMTLRHERLREVHAQGLITDHEFAMELEKIVWQFTSQPRAHSVTGG